MLDRWRSAALSLCLSLWLCPPAAAQVPAGSEFLVSTSTTNSGFIPSVAAEPGGGFVVAWLDMGQPRVSVRWFDPRGAALGTERQMGAPSFSYSYSVAADSRSTVVAWTEPDSLLGHAFTHSGESRGVEFLIGGNDDIYNRPALAAVPGGFLSAWVRVQGQDGSIRARRYGRSGVPVDVEFTVSAYTSGVSDPPAIAASEQGDFVVVWTVERGAEADIVGQLMSAAGTPRGVQFRVNEVANGDRWSPRVTSDDAGNFVVVWLDNLSTTIKARRFDAAGSPRGSEFVVESFPLFAGFYWMDAAGDRAGNFTVVWDADAGPDTVPQDVMGLRFTAAGLRRGEEFRVNTYTTQVQRLPGIGDDGHGNVVVAWEDHRISQDITRPHIFARRFGGLVPAGLSVADGGNGILEAAETFAAATAWRNVNGAAQAFEGRSSNVSVPGGLSLSLSSEVSYGTVPDGVVGACTAPCFTGTLLGSRPWGHVDVRFLETIAPDVFGQTQRWALHVGESFVDVLRTSLFYRSIETLLHHGVTSGCGGNAYCPAGSTTREQMSVFLLAAREGEGYQPPACTTPVFGDVPASSPFCRWVEELARRGVTAGCGGGNYCPAAAVSREQMAVFVLRTLDPALNPPACTTPVFGDVPANSPFCRWIEELARRGIVTGCGGANYCPTDPVTREQMAVFLTGTFGLTLYGP
jgi:hypothetical protein